MIVPTGKPKKSTHKKNLNRRYPHLVDARTHTEQQIKQMVENEHREWKVKFAHPSQKTTRVKPHSEHYGTEKRKHYQNDGKYSDGSEDRGGRNGAHAGFSFCRRRPASWSMSSVLGKQKRILVLPSSGWA